MEILTEKGIIIEKKGNILKIAIPRKPECEHCNSLLCDKTNQGNVLIEIETNEQFEIGEKVEIQILGKQLISVTLFLYLIPLLLLTISLVICQQIAYLSVVQSTIIAFSCVGLYYLLLKKLNFIRTKPQLKRIETEK